MKSGLRLAILAMATLVLGGCSTYYQSYYPDSGVYYEDSGVYGRSAGYSRVGYGPVNPVVYPYWSIDYFYFSQFYHPYSVYVGYNEPLYYPYPGWALGHYRPSRWHGSLAFGFGYPWYGHGYRYPAYTFGFFSGYDPYYHGVHYRRDRHRIRHIDSRLEALQHGDSYASRRDLLGRDRIAGRPGGGLYDSRGGYRDAGARPQSRADILRQQSAGNSRALQRRAVAPDRSVQRRAPDIRSERRPDRRTIDRDRIRRDGGASSASEGHRGIPIEGLRGRVIVNSRNRAPDDARGRDSLRRDRIDDGNRIGGAQNIRRAPAVDWGRAERRSGRESAPVIRRDADPARGSLLNRSTRSSGAPPQRPDHRAASPPRPSRDVGRPDPRSRASSAPPSRRDLMRQRSGNDRSGRNGRDRRGDRRG